MPGLITNTALEAHRVGLSARFNKMLMATVGMAAILATEISSTTKTQTYSWLGKFPKFKKWIGERRFETIKENAYQITNEKFTADMEIELDDWEDDNLGQYGAVIDGWGVQAGEFKDDRIIDALVNGHTRQCYDGQYFFDTDHVVEYKDENGTIQKATVSNNLGVGAVQPWFLVDLSQFIKPIIFQNRKSPTFRMDTDSTLVEKQQKIELMSTARAGNGYSLWQLAVRSTVALDETSYEAAKAVMTGLKGEDGQPLGLKPTHIVVGLSNEAAAQKLFNRAVVGATDNYLFQAVKVLSLAKLA